MRFEVLGFAASLQSFCESASKPPFGTLLTAGGPNWTGPSSKLDGRTEVPDIFLRALGYQHSPPETSCESKCWILLHFCKVFSEVPLNRPLDSLLTAGGSEALLRKLCRNAAKSNNSIGMMFRGVNLGIQAHVGKYRAPRYGYPALSRGPSKSEHLQSKGVQRAVLRHF